MIIELGQFKLDQVGANVMPDAELRDQLKAHLDECALLGAKVDHENLADLAVALRQAAGVMSILANLAEKYALNEK
ncbi:MAG: hypothetical protein COA85_03375 [Robiginitomaculum sp.]|nr:MAG: hypothetical protein COA85_03375 [Robiginitomaculum sp.]